MTIGNTHPTLYFQLYSFLTASKDEQIDTLCGLFNIEKILSEGRSDDYERYVNMGLHIDPNNSIFLYRNGNFSSNTNIVNISAALFTSSLSIFIMNSQYEESARYVNDIRVTTITF